MGHRRHFGQWGFDALARFHFVLSVRQKACEIARRPAGHSSIKLTNARLAITQDAKVNKICATQHTNAANRTKQHGAAMPRFLILAGVILLMADYSFAQDYSPDPTPAQCQLIKQAVAQYGYAASRRYALENYGPDVVKTGDKCFTKRAGQGNNLSAWNPAQRGGLHGRTDDRNALARLSDAGLIAQPSDTAPLCATPTIR
jgi:hypothetical protein